jgi:hypothetical protein
MEESKHAARRRLNDILSIGAPRNEIKKQGRKPRFHAEALRLNNMFLKVFRALKVTITFINRDLFSLFLNRILLKCSVSSRPRQGAITHYSAPAKSNQVR